MTINIYKAVWEDLVINHNAKNAQEKFKLSSQDIQFIIGYTMPEMFISSELNEVHKGRSAELETEYAKLDEIHKQKKRNVIVYKIMSISYSIIMFPVLAIIAYIINS